MVCDTSRGTTLGNGDDVVMTVEHLLSALWACGISAARIQCSGKEIPVLDGSSAVFLDMLEDAGAAPCGSDGLVFSPESPLFVSRGGAFAGILPGEGFSAEYFLDYEHPMIGAQSFFYDGSYEAYKSFIAPSRTFVLYEEVKALLENNLARGGTVDNCIVTFRDRFSSPLRHPGELPGHKLLDILGDLSLCGARLEGRVIAYKSGHRLNTELAFCLQQAVEKEAGRQVP
ncbi:MAG: UDP-3-O-acyl-N-acetylglucosamine deacetylase [Abditibacteriota bacterium]|nr:UDP-3-O-acyl-N-acetylglucosamine deacetylase [Abditibacteriota bacterium]